MINFLADKVIRDDFYDEKNPFIPMGMPDLGIPKTLNQDFPGKNGIPPEVQLPTGDILKTNEMLSDIQNAGVKAPKKVILKKGKSLTEANIIKAFNDSGASLPSTFKFSGTTKSEISNVQNVKLKEDFVIPAGANLDTDDIIMQLGGDLKKFRVALLDTGVDKEHPAFAGTSILIKSLVNDETKGIDNHGHGTHIAGIITAKPVIKREGHAGANYAQPMQGIIPGASIVSYKITEGSSSQTRWSTVFLALKKVLEFNEVEFKKHVNKRRPICVINLSFNAMDNLDPNQRIQGKFYDLIDELGKQKVPIVVSGGNHFHHFLSMPPRPKAKKRSKYGVAFPACFDNIIACGAACSMGTFEGLGMSPSELAPFTQRPYESSDNFFVVPAVKTNSTYLEGQYAELTGSSMAAPVVTGIIFLLQQQFAQDNQGHLPTVRSVRNALVKMSDSISNKPISQFANDNRLIYPKLLYYNKLYYHINTTRFDDAVSLLKK